MDIPLNRESGVPIRDQLVVYLEMRILDGTLKPGERLPSVRALARRLKIHSNTVSAAYKDLQSTGRVRLRTGSGVFVYEAGSVIGICFLGSRDDRAAGRPAPSTGPAPPPQARPSSPGQAAPPEWGGVSGAPDTAVQRSFSMMIVSTQRPSTRPCCL